MQTARSPTLNLTKETNQNGFYFSVLPQGQVNFFGMQPVTGTDYAVELETSSKDHDNDLLLSPAHDRSTDIVAAEESHLYYNVKELIAPGKIYIYIYLITEMRYKSLCNLEQRLTKSTKPIHCFCNYIPLTSNVYNVFYLLVAL